MDFIRNADGTVTVRIPSDGPVVYEPTARIEYIEETVTDEKLAALLIAFADALPEDH